jgi:hypothetical protein
MLSWSGNIRTGTAIRLLRHLRVIPGMSCCVTMRKAVSMSEWEIIKADIEAIKKELGTIRDNDLHSIEAWLMSLDKDVGHLRWFFMAGLGILAAVIALIACFG